MIKILTALQIRDADEYTIKNEPISSIDLMERAANAFVLQLENDFPNNHLPIHIFCGNGNNGGDGLAIARILLHKKQSINIYIFRAKKSSNDFTNNYQRLVKKYKKCIQFIDEKKIINKIPEHAIIIDAIFGTGLNKPIQEKSLEYYIIQEINNRHFSEVISVDIPSGLFANKSNNDMAVRASKTYTFQFPKLSLLIPETGKYANDLKILDISLHQDYITKADATYFYTTKDDIEKKLKTRTKYTHKGTYGHALVIAGSYGKVGAAILATKATLRAGCGLVSVHVPACGYEIIQTAFPEAMCSVDKQEKYFSSISCDEKYNTIAIGPGIGTHTSTIKAFESLVRKIKKPLVVDADAINILSKKQNLLKYIPSNSILTPHPKEFERLVGIWKNDIERLALQQAFSKKHKVIIVLKGANTSISDTNGNIYFNSSGNAGMATGGSGDVLTGIITGLLAQQYSSIDAAIVGVYLHGLAADIALKNQSMESLIASDIIDSLGNAFNEIRNHTA